MNLELLKSRFTNYELAEGALQAAAHYISIYDFQTEVDSDIHRVFRIPSKRKGNKENLEQALKQIALAQRICRDFESIEISYRENKKIRASDLMEKLREYGL